MWVEEGAIVVLRNGERLGWVRVILRSSKRLG